MKKLRDVTIDPPSGWVYPITKELAIAGAGYQDLIQQVLQHYAVNEIPVPPDLEQKITDWLCLHNPHGWCIDESGNSPFSLRHTLAQLVAGSEAMIHMIKHGKADLVPIQESETRANICRQCSFMSPNACAPCSGMRKVFGKMVEDRWLAADQSLLSCAICGCFIGVMVNFSGPALRAITSKEKIGHYPKEFTGHTGRVYHCWKRAVLEEGDK